VIEDHPFTPGTAVIVQSHYSHYDDGTFSADTVLKVHKTGRFTLMSDPKRQWAAMRSGWEGDKTWFARPTDSRGGYGVYSTRLRLSDDAAKTEMEKAQAKRAHQKRCKAIAEAFTKPDKISFDLSAQVIVLLPKATT
jgi:hypothetical protein